MNLRDLADPAAAGSFSRYRRECGLLLLLILVQLIFTLFVTVPGHVSVDEGTYHMMVQNFAESGTLEIWNGYDEFPSIELQAAGNLRAHKGSLVSQYPYLSGVLATPFYWISGYPGLFFLNSLAFLLTILVCYALARSLFEDRKLALNSCSVLVLATYLWEYSQAAWPHAVAVLFVTAAAYCVARGLKLGRGAQTLYFPAAAGLLIGSGAGIRLDVILAAPALAMALALAPSQRLKKILAFCAGLGPGLAILSLTNHFKFGTISPFSYGGGGTATSGPAAYSPLVLWSLILLFAIWISRKVMARWQPGRKNTAVLGFSAAILVAAILIRSSEGLLFQLLSGALQILVDLRFRDPDIIEPAMIRTASGAIVYIHAFKKSLLQSCSYLPIVVLPLLQAINGLPSRPGIAGAAVLYLLPLSYCGVFSFFAWHGGLCLNLRYLLPILPFTSILTAWAWRELSKGRKGNWRRSVTFVGLPTVILFSLFALPNTADLTPAHEFWILTFPLLIAGLISALAFFHLFLAQGSRRISGLLATAVLGAMFWSGLIVFTYDYPRSALFRYFNSRLSDSLVEHIAPDSLVFMDDYNYVGLLKVERIRLAVPKASRERKSDDFRDFKPLMDYHLARNRNVYAVFRLEFWKMVRRRGLLDGIPIRTLWEDEQFRLAQFELPEEEDLEIRGYGQLLKADIEDADGLVGIRMTQIMRKDGPVIGC